MASTIILFYIETGDDTEKSCNLQGVFANEAASIAYLRR